MYVARFSREGLLWTVVVFEKIWSEEIQSHEAKEIKSKKFLFHNQAYRWIEKEVCKSLFYKHKLEIIDG